MNVKAVILKFLFTLGVLCHTSRQGEIYERLIKDLLDPNRHDRKVRPAESPSLPINVSIALALHYIENLSWYDYQLKWNETKYNGIKVVSLSPKLIWIPDIFLYSTADGRFGAGRRRINAVINSNGIVTLDYPAVFKTSCDMIIDKYPFDYQNCSIRLGSWVYASNKLKLLLKDKTINLKYYIANGEWELQSSTINLLAYEGTDVWDSVVISFCLKRMALYHSMYYLIPCGMIGLMTIIVFILPVNMNERMTVGLTLLIALSFFFLLMAENLPAIAETVPIAAKYYTATTVLSAFAYYMTCIVLKCHFSNPLEGDAPNWIRVLVLDWIASLLFMKETADNENNSEDEFNIEHIQDQARKAPKKREMTKEERRSNSVIKNSVRLQATLDGRKDEWNKIAHVLNRLFMILYTTAFLLLSVMLLSSAVW